VTFIDDASRKVWAYFMKNKGEVFEIFENFHVFVGREIKKLLKCLRTYNGGEYFSNSFKDYCNRFGIKHEKIVPGTPQQNGFVERMNHTIMEKVRSMLSNYRLEKHFLAEVIRITCYIINQSPFATLDGGVHEEVRTRKKVNYSHLKFFGCEEFVDIPKEKITKPNDKSMKCIFYGICCW